MDILGPLTPILVLLYSVANSQGSLISFTGSPSDVKDGLTHTVRLTCALNDTAASAGVIGRRDVTHETSRGSRRDINGVSETPYNVAEVLSIIVSRNNSDLAVVTHTDPAKVKDATYSNVQASGALKNFQNSASGQGVLEVTWEHPSATQLENLECRVTALDQSGHSVEFVKAFEFEVSEPSIKDIIAHVAMLEKEKDTANAKIQNLESMVASANLEIQNLKHIETGRVCEHTEPAHMSGDGDNRDTTFNVQFQKAYTKPPKVVFGMSSIDSIKEFNLRITAIAENISNNGFVARIHVWADTQIYSACFDWTSIPQD